MSGAKIGAMGAEAEQGSCQCAGVLKQGVVDRVASLMLSLLVMIAVCTVLWFSFSPPAGKLVRSAGIFPSVQPDAGVPFVSQAANRLFEVLLVALVVGTVLLAPPIHRARHRFAARGRIHGALIAACQSALGLIAVLALAERAPVETLDVLGWGPLRLFAGAAIALSLIGGIAFAWRRLETRDTRRARRFLARGVSVAAALIGSVYLLSIIETSRSVKNIFDTGFVVNELLAPANGLHPLAGYAAQYTNLLGYLLVPVVRVGIDPVSAAVVLIMLLTAAVIGLGILTFRRVGVSWPWATSGMVLVVALTSAAYRFGIAFPAPTRTIHFPFTAFAYPQILPLRFVGPFVLGYLVTRLAKTPGRRANCMIGFAAGVVACNNPDFGGGAAAAALLSALLWTPPGTTTRFSLRTGLTRMRDMLAGVLTALVAVCLFVVLVSGRWPDVRTGTFYERLYGGGANGLPLTQAWNLHLVVIGTFVIGLVVALAGWATGPRREAEPQRGDSDAALVVTLAYFSLFGLVTVVYYLNRPVTLVLVAGCFFVWGTCLVLLAVAALRASRQTVKKLAIGTLVVTVVFCTAFAQVAFLPSVPNELSRLNDGRKGGANAIVVNRDIDPHAQREEIFIREHERKGNQVAIIGYWPNTLALRAGVVSVTPFSDVSQFKFFVELDLLTKRLTEDHHPDVYFDPTFPYPEIPQALTDVGYTEIARSPDFVLFRQLS